MVTNWGDLTCEKHVRVSKVFTDRGQVFKQLAIPNSSITDRDFGHVYGRIGQAKVVFGNIRLNLVEQSRAQKWARVYNVSSSITFSHQMKRPSCQRWEDLSQVGQE